MRPKRQILILLLLQKKAEDLGAGEIILNYIDNDSLMNGYNLELIHEDFEKREYSCYCRMRGRQFESYEAWLWIAEHMLLQQAACLYIMARAEQSGKLPHKGRINIGFKN